MKPSLSIITVCKGRLEHLKQSLPRMLEQDGAEVVVVDYSCPEGAGDYVEKHFPDARVVRVEGEAGFSIWKARNRGAAVATSGRLLFCDADTILAPTAAATIAKTVTDRSYAFAAGDLNGTATGLANNRLRGFQALPAAAFRRLGGYDEILSGYASGGDRDLEERLLLSGFEPKRLSEGVIERVIDHDDSARTAFYDEPIALSYGAGLLYRRAKLALLKTRKRGLPKADRQRLYAAARRAAERIAGGEEAASMQVQLEDIAVGMPRQLGFEQGRCTVSINVRLSLRNKLDSRAL